MLERQMRKNQQPYPRGKNARKWKAERFQEIGKTTNKATAYNERAESQPVTLKYSHGIGGRISVFNDIY